MKESIQSHWKWELNKVIEREGVKKVYIILRYQWTMN